MNFSPNDIILGLVFSSTTLATVKTGMLTEEREIKTESREFEGAAIKVWFIVHGIHKTLVSSLGDQHDFLNNRRHFLFSVSSYHEYTLRIFQAL